MILTFPGDLRLFTTSSLTSRTRKKNRWEHGTLHQSCHLSKSVAAKEAGLGPVHMQHFWNQRQREHSFNKTMTEKPTVHRTSCYWQRDYNEARFSSVPHDSRSRVSAMWQGVGKAIAEGMSVLAGFLSWATTETYKFIRIKKLSVPITLQYNKEKNHIKTLETITKSY